MTATQAERFDPEIVLEPVTETRAAAPQMRAPGSSLLRRLLVLLDASGVAVGWATGLLLTGGLTSTARPGGSVPAVAFIVVMTAITIALVAGQGLYLSRVCSIRSVEIGRLSRASVAAAAAGLLAPRLLPLELSVPGAAVSAALAFLLLVLMRDCYRYWLQSGRRDGRFLRRVVVGTNEEGYDLCQLTREHPEMGYSVTGIVGSHHTTADFDVPILGGIEDAPSVCRATGANGALIAASALPPRALNALVRRLLHDGLHVHLSTGLRGIDHRRLRAQPLAHEPLFYLEPLHLRRWQAAVKRAVDVAGAVVGGVLFAAPVILVAAVAIKVNDRGAVFYRQTRVGRHGVPFRILKLRTMSEDAELRYDDLAAARAGRDGPLIKLTDDPRRTAVGRFLERLSIDELPQLWNVLTGDMSLVGPRPAQSVEVAQFDDALLARLDVRPGISGLWQVEARDNPSFSAYRRYDLFYLENWSVSLDVAILMATVQHVLLRGIAFTLGQRPEMAAPAPRTVATD